MKFPFRKKSDRKATPTPLRTKLGWILVGMGALVAYGFFRYYHAQDATLLELNRTFVILFLLWLAWPELEGLPRWILILVPICAIVCAWRPQYLVIVLPAAILYLVLRPPAKRAQKKSKKSSNSLTKTKK
jgi:hypothetical protein